MFFIRLFSSITILAVTIATTILGGPVLLGTLLAISLMGMFELYRSLHLHKTWLAVLGYVSAIVYYLMLYLQKIDYLMPVVVVSFILIMVLYVLAYPRYDSKQVTMVFFGIFYVAVLLSYIYRTRSLNGGAYMVWLVYIGAWGSDTCAYVVGMLIGKRHLPSELSPKKTIEGCLGGIMGAALIGFLFAGIFSGKLTIHNNPQWLFAIMGSLAAILSQIGDLAASAIKRNHGIKDYGNIIPGHGGILDRFDSILLVAPIVFYFIGSG